MFLISHGGAHCGSWGCHSRTIQWAAPSVPWLGQWAWTTPQTQPSRSLPTRCLGRFHLGGGVIGDRTSASNPRWGVGFASVAKAMARPLVLCGPSGSGKSTLTKRLLEEFPDQFGLSVSHTTRSPRAGEVEDVHYHYVAKEEMLKAIANGEFIESAQFSGNFYGTSKKAVAAVLAKGRICILDIDVQGVIQIKKLPEFKPFYVFIRPPNLDVLEARLRGRQTETEESLQKRLAAAKVEMDYGNDINNFDIVIENNDLDKAYSELREFLAQNALQPKAK
ncbi:hypothetical protein TCAL_08807 [Tigriopus californicus]|uniref:guanylate kinase n=1 Tax=Tigriopus californicus TaxID=6832 RepID=A0A553P637_TIGCA|nr:guanylate kinase-like [Tigriopus californicus]XP_059079635.1 guanylate kinase-like [Tigriopus californicus]XP_059079636.1 guanylate kinase-like [Tigriopus californicus]TRY73132.1 hypothetical protein TCAL_08807 [Tigriopus californicus]